MSSGAYHAKNITDNTEDLITGRSSTTVLDTAGSGANFGSAGEFYGIYPPAGTGFNLNFSILIDPSTLEADFKIFSI